MRRPETSPLDKVIILVVLVGALHAACASSSTEQVPVPKDLKRPITAAEASAMMLRLGEHPPASEAAALKERLADYLKTGR